MRVHFICRGNAYRSRLAQGYLQSLHTGKEVVSSGTVAAAHRDNNHPRVTGYTEAFLHSQGIYPDLASSPVQLTQEQLRADDVIVCINDLVMRDIRRAGFELPTDVRVWDITDVDEQPGPFREHLGREEHTKRIFKQIRQNVDALVRELQ